MNRRSNSGFTLIEVLFAMGLIALGMAAAFNTVIDAAHNTAYLKERTMAEWVALNRLTELRLQDQLPETGESDDEVEYANQDWEWTARVSETPVEDLMRVDISVALAEEPDSRIVTISGFIGPRMAAQTNAVPWTGGERGSDGPPGDDDQVNDEDKVGEDENDPTS